MKPVSPPALADADFLFFNTTNQNFVVTGAAAKRLALTIWSLAKNGGAARVSAGVDLFKTMKLINGSDAHEANP